MGEAEDAADHLGPGEAQRILEQGAHESPPLLFHRRPVIVGWKEVAG